MPTTTRLSRASGSSAHNRATNRRDAGCDAYGGSTGTCRAELRGHSKANTRAAGCYADLYPASPPPKKSYQIALFVNADATSQRLQEWFTQNKQLATLKESCEFQVYTATNAIYKTRYVDIVPAEQFPVVLFQDATGGHIHAAGRSMIPSTPEELYSDLRHGYLLYKQAKQAQKTGAVKTKGYSWDDAITPTLYLSAEDCPDGYCPTPPSEDRRPLDRVRDLFDGATDTRNALMWLSAGEIATVALIGIAAVLLVFILIKRGIS